MLRIKSGYILAGVLCIALSACGKKEPTGQVAAVLDGKEITTLQITNELNGFQAPTPQIRQQAERQALDQILARKALSEAAKKAKIDKTPGFALKLERADEALLIQAWQEQLAKAVPAPSKEEIDKFIAAHPDIYASRKIYDVEQIRMAKPTNAALVKGLQPLNSLPEVEAYLTANHVPFRQGVDKVDALAVDPAMVDQIAKMPPGEIFIAPAGNLITINHITGSTVQPVAPDLADKHASAYLKNQHTQQAIYRQFQGVLAAARKDVKYNKTFQPPAAPKPPAAGAAPAPATAPAAAPAPAAKP